MQYWERKKLEYAQNGRRLLKLTEALSMAEWILGDPTATNLKECAEVRGRDGFPRQGLDAIVASRSYCCFLLVRLYFFCDESSLGLTRMFPCPRALMMIAFFCAEQYVANADYDGSGLGLFEHQSEHASFRIITPSATIRLSHGRYSTHSRCDHTSSTARAHPECLILAASSAC